MHKNHKKLLTDADGSGCIPGPANAGRVFISNELVAGEAAVPDDPAAASRPDPSVFHPRRRAMG